MPLNCLFKEEGRAPTGEALINLIRNPARITQIRPGDDTRDELLKRSNGGHIHPDEDDNPPLGEEVSIGAGSSYVLGIGRRGEDDTLLLAELGNRVEIIQSMLEGTCQGGRVAELGGDGDQLVELVH